jgi:hypothetical protein
MKTDGLTVICATHSTVWYTVIWGLFLPLLLAYLSTAAYAFQRRRGDFASALEGLETMSELTMLALERINGATVDSKNVHRLGSRFVRRIRLESLHRPKAVQEEMHELLEEFLKNADIADGKAAGTGQEIINRTTAVENRIVQMLNEQTIFETLKQAWTNPGIQVSFDRISERFRRNSEHDSQS